MGLTLRRATDISDEVSVNRAQTYSVERTKPGAFVHFEGRDWETGFRGSGRRQGFQGSALFGRDEHELLAAFEYFLERAAEAADARVEVVPDLTSVTSANAPYLVEVHTWTRSHRPAGVVEISFSGQRVG